MDNQFGLKFVQELCDNLKKPSNNAYFLCHGGLGDLFMMVGAIRFLSLFYIEIILFCPLPSLKHLKKLFSDINIKFITYEKWYEKVNTNNIWPKVDESCFKTAVKELKPLYSIEKYKIFDWIKYININADLNIIKTKEEDWYNFINFGKKEGRIFYIDKDLINLDNFDEEEFDWIKYTNTYPELKIIKTKEEAWDHWINFGKNEGRNYCINDKKIINDLFIASKTFNLYIDGYVSIETRNKYNINSFNSIISEKNFLNYCQNFKSRNYEEPFYIGIRNFYEILNLDLSIYYDYFFIPANIKSLENYKILSNYNYKIVFLHFVSSCGESFIPIDEWNHILSPEYIIINPDKNFYNSNIDLDKYNLANQFLNLDILDYIDIIINASDIYVCDSCFANLVFPLRKTNKLKATNIIIYDRFYPFDNPNIKTPIRL